MESLLGFLRNRECEHSQGLPEIFWVPLLSQERVKLRTSNLVRRTHIHTHRVDRNKSP